MNISQAESAIGATVAYLGFLAVDGSIDIGVIHSVNEQYAFVKFHDIIRGPHARRRGFSLSVANTPVACYPQELMFYYAPLVRQLEADYANCRTTVGDRHA